MAATASEVVRGAQSILRVTGSPTLQVDGIVGPKTVYAYDNAPDYVVRALKEYAKANGFNADNLFAPLVRSATVIPASTRSRIVPEAAPSVPATRSASLRLEKPSIPSRTTTMNLTPQALFIKNLVPQAIAEAQRSGLSAELVLAQAALESNWGRSQSAIKANNLFGVKASAQWAGKTLNMITREVRRGASVMENAAWRVYDSVGDALKDRTNFLKTNPRYTKAGLFAANVLGDPIAEAKALLKAGYATDPTYVRKIEDVLSGRTMKEGLAAVGYALNSSMKMVAMARQLGG